MPGKDAISRNGSANLARKNDTVSKYYLTDKRGDTGDILYADICDVEGCEFPTAPFFASLAQAGTEFSEIRNS